MNTAARIVPQMVTHDVVQGSPEWLELRATKLTASEAPVIMGCHPNMRRDELLEAKATYSPKEFSSYVEEVIFADGHETEAKARPILEMIIGEDLYPVTGSNGKYLASYDGINSMDAEDTGFEHKQWNADLAMLVQAGKPPAYIFWQLEHQLMVNPALRRIILVVSDGTGDNWAEMEYTAVPGRREQLIAGWDQFERDLEEFMPALKSVEAVGKKPLELMVLNVEVSGDLVTKDNLREFRASVDAMLDSIKTDLQTDQDFADADVAVKQLDAGEKRIDLVMDQSLAKTASLNSLFTALRAAKEDMRQVRLSLGKKIEAQKTNRKTQIVADATVALSQAIERANLEFAQHKVYVSIERRDFYAVIKGKRSFDMMQSAINDALAGAKIDLYAACDRVRANLKTLLTEAENHLFLFPDKQAMASMDPQLLALTIPAKIREYEEGEALKERNRKEAHQNRITAIKAAADFDEDLPYEILVTTRKRIETIDTTSMQEFMLAADQAKAATVAALTQRIDVLRKQAADAEAEQERRAQAEHDRQKEAATAIVEAIAPTPVLAPEMDALPGTDDLDDYAEIHDYAVTHETAEQSDKAFGEQGGSGFSEAENLQVRIREAVNSVELPRDVKALLLDIHAYLDGQ